MYLDSPTLFTGYHADCITHENHHVVGPLLLIDKHQGQILGLYSLTISFYGGWIGLRSMTVSSACFSPSLNSSTSSHLASSTDASSSSHSSATTLMWFSLCETATDDLLRLRLAGDFLLLRMEDLLNAFFLLDREIVDVLRAEIVEILFLSFHLDGVDHSLDSRYLPYPVLDFLVLTGLVFLGLSYRGHISLTEITDDLLFDIL